MRGWARFVAVIAIACVCAPAWAQNAPPPVEAFGRLPAIQHIAISPDGTRLAVIAGLPYRVDQPNRELTAFRVLNLETGRPEHELAPPDRNTLRGVGWADDARPFYIISMQTHAGDMAPAHLRRFMSRGRRAEYFRVGLFTLATGRSRLFENNDAWANSGLGTLMAPVEGDPGYGRMVAWAGISLNTEAMLTVFRVNLDTGVWRSTGSGGTVLTRDYMLNAQGEIAFRLDVDDVANRWRLYSYADGADRVILEDTFVTGLWLDMRGVLADGRLAARHQQSEGGYVLVGVDPRTGATEELHTPARGSDVDVVTDPWTHQVVGTSWIDDLPKQHFYEADLQRAYDAVAAQFADGYAVLQSWSRDRARIVVFGEHAEDAGAYYVYDVEARRLRRVGLRYPDVNSLAHLGERRSIQYRARDGTSIPAYLTLPAGAEARNLPLVLLVHGGPHSRDDFRFDYMASFLASRGYAVLQANFRGSTGYGFEWFNAGRGGWGDGVMQTDVEDGVDALVRAGMVDPQRVCIAGLSYGGYAALAGATLTPEKYACAISINGLSDPISLLNVAQQGALGTRNSGAEWWRASMGADDMAHLRRVTPIDHAEAVRAPILILHGRDDAVVSVEQSRTMAARLRRANKDVRFVELQGDDHWLSEAPSRTQVLREMEQFLAQHIGADAP